MSPLKPVVKIPGESQASYVERLYQANGFKYLEPDALKDEAYRVSNRDNGNGVVGVGVKVKQRQMPLK